MGNGCSTNDSNHELAIAIRYDDLSMGLRALSRRADPNVGMRRLREEHALEHVHEWIRLLLTYGASLWSSTQDDSPFLFVLRCGDLNNLHDCLRRDALSFEVNRRLAIWTVVTSETASDKLRKLECLIAHGADPDGSPLAYAFPTPLCNAIVTQDIPAAMMLAKVANVNLTKPMDDDYEYKQFLSARLSPYHAYSHVFTDPLSVAVLFSEWNLIRVLLERGADVGRPAVLLAAAISNSTRMLRIILHNRPDLDDSLAEGFVLHIACRNRNETFVRLLLDAGVGPNPMPFASVGKTPLTKTLLDGLDGRIGIARLLIERGGVDVRNYGMLEAVRNSRYEVIRFWADVHDSVSEELVEEAVRVDDLMILDILLPLCKMDDAVLVRRAARYGAPKVFHKFMRGVPRISGSDWFSHPRITFTMLSKTTVELLSLVCSAFRGRHVDSLRVLYRAIVWKYGANVAGVIDLRFCSDRGWRMSGAEEECYRVLLRPLLDPRSRRSGRRGKMYASSPLRWLPWHVSKEMLSYLVPRPAEPEWNVLEFVYP